MLTDEHLYTLTRTEFAKAIGKSREAVKKDMQRGKYKQLYIFKNGQYYFKTREGVRENKGLSPVDLYPVKKSKVNRGGHESAVRKGRYPNNAFAEHNHTKRNPYSNYTSGLINYSNPGYDSPYFHNGRAHHLQPTNFQETNRGKKIDWSNKYYG